MAIVAFAMQQTIMLTFNIEGLPVVLSFMLGGYWDTMYDKVMKI